ncbi:MAG: sugar phosphate isomerase/epimerase [Armatimonadetes bacterium]|nr:sugar phosphate isomerase/epimerase [Armatimonadota bacterium]
MSWKLSAFADEIDGDIEVQFAHLKENGIGLVDLRSAYGKNVMALSDEEIASYVARAADFGVTVNCIGSPVNKVVMADSPAEAELDKTKRAIEAAKLAGTNRIRFFTPQGDDFDAVCAWIEPQIKAADEAGVVLMHENDAKYYGAYPDNAKKLVERFASPSFRFAFDFANTVQIGFRAMDDWFPWLLPYLETIHIKDAREDGKVVPAGEGVGQVKETLAWLKAQGWEGVLSIEPHLQFAGDRGGFSGIESFQIATNAIKGIMAGL